MTFRSYDCPFCFVRLYIVSDGSMAASPSAVRHRPIPSKFSRASPMGSISLWQLAQTVLLRCWAMRSRMESDFSGASFNGGTFAGGDGGGVPRIFVRTYLPRLTGDVRLAIEVKVRMLPWPRSPLR